MGVGNAEHQENPILCLISLLMLGPVLSILYSFCVILQACIIILPWQKENYWSLENVNEIPKITQGHTTGQGQRDSVGSGQRGLAPDPYVHFITLRCYLFLPSRQAQESQPLPSIHSHFSLPLVIFHQFGFFAPTIDAEM